MAVRTGVDIELRTRDLATQDIGKVDKGLENLAKTGTQKTGVQLVAAFAKVGGAIAGAGFALKKAFDAAQYTAQVGQIQMAFDSITTKAGQVSRDVLNSMRDMSAGTISSMDMMLSANRASLLGIPVDKFDDLMKIARASAAATGASVTDMFNDIVVGIGRSSPMILDNLGIIVKEGEANEKWAKAMGKTVQQMTEVDKRAALLNAVLAQGESIMERVGKAGRQVTDAQLFQQMTAAATDLTVQIGKLPLFFIRELLPAATQILRTLAGWGEALEAAAKKAKEVVVAVALETIRKEFVLPTFEFFALDQDIRSYGDKLKTLYLDMIKTGAKMIDIETAHRDVVKQVMDRINKILKDQQEIAAMGPENVRRLKDELKYLEGQLALRNKGIAAAKAEAEATERTRKALEAQTKLREQLSSIYGKMLDFYPEEMQKLLKSRQQIEDNISDLKNMLLKPIPPVIQKAIAESLGFQENELRRVIERIESMYLSGAASFADAAKEIEKGLGDIIAGFPQVDMAQLMEMSGLGGGFAAMEQAIIAGMQGREIKVSIPAGAVKLDLDFGFLKTLTDSLYDFGNFFVNLGPGITGFFQSMWTALSNPVQLLLNMGDAAINGFRAFTDALKKGAESLANFAIQGLMKFGQWILNMVMSAEPLQKVFTDLSALMQTVINVAIAPLIEALSPVIEIIKELFLTLGSYLIPIFQIFGMLIKALEPLWKAIASILGVVFKILWQLAPIFAVVAQIIGNVITPILQMLTPILEMISQLFTALMPVIEILLKALDILSRPVEIVGLIIGWLATKLIALGQLLIYIITFQWGKIKNIDWGMTVGQLWNAISDILTRPLVDIGAYETEVTPITLPEGTTPGGAAPGSETTVERVPDIYIYQTFTGNVIGDGGMAAVGRFTADALRVHAGLGGVIHIEEAIVPIA